MLVSAAAFCMLFPVVLLRGMSLDGVIYATIARNLAVGIGDFWHPYYTATLLHPFHEQPPLAFLLEGMFFAALGDQWWVERLYSVLTVVPTIGVLVLIWRRLLSGGPYQRFSWLPILFWIVMPAWFWIYRHNYLENTLGMFTALAVYASLRAADARRWWAAWTIVAAAAIVGALGIERSGGTVSRSDSDNRLVDFAPHELCAGGRIANCASWARWRCWPVWSGCIKEHASIYQRTSKGRC